MTQKPLVFVVIATSQHRTDWLINRSLPSVYAQINVEPSDVAVFVIDDNAEEAQFENIKAQISSLRKRLALPHHHFRTVTLRNNRTRFMSGTGAWNTGIFAAGFCNMDGYISILDDDDAYLPEHLADCLNASTPHVAGVFQRLCWYNQDQTVMHSPLSSELLKPEQFFIGNPGVQGSNMFFRTRTLLAIGGFDESLPNTTDRDLMIRFLWHIEQLKNKAVQSSETVVLRKIGVMHYNHNRQKVNNNLQLKQQGLELFYKKYRPHFSTAAYQQSLKRAQNFFNYKPVI